MDLQAIEARLEAAERSPFGSIPSEDVRALIAEVERLTAQIAALLTEVEQVRTKK